jgi:hypothetical protein
MPGWNAPPPRPASRKRWLIGCLVLVIVLVIGVAGCAVFFVRSFGSAGEVVLASDGRIDQFNVRSINGVTHVTFWAARGIDAAEGPALACDVIVPSLSGTELASADWVLLNRAGDVIATDETPC